MVLYFLCSGLSRLQSSIQTKSIYIYYFDRSFHEGRVSGLHFNKIYHAKQKGKRSRHSNEIFRPTPVGVEDIDNIDQR